MERTFEVNMKEDEVPMSPLASPYLGRPENVNTTWASALKPRKNHRQPPSRARRMHQNRGDSDDDDDDDCNESNGDNDDNGALVSSLAGAYKYQNGSRWMPPLAVPPPPPPELGTSSRQRPRGPSMECSIDEESPLLMASSLPFVSHHASSLPFVPHASGDHTIAVGATYSGARAHAHANNESGGLEDAEQQKGVETLHHKRIRSNPIPYTHIQNNRGSGNNRSKRSNSADNAQWADGLSRSVASGMDETEGGAQTVLEYVEEVAQDAMTNFAETREEAWEEYKDNCHYDWREHWKGGNCCNFVKFLLTGFAPHVKQTDDQVQDHLNGLARLISLLREYHERFGMPTKGGPRDHEYILREITKDLYLGGAPLWTLEPVMKKVAEGLTGKKGVDFFMLPRRAFIFAPSSGATSMFPISRGYDIQRLDAMEKVAVRLASFASNTQSVSNVPARLPKPQELRRAFRTESVSGVQLCREEMSEEILNLAGEAEGLFFFINSRQYKVAARDLHATSMEEKTHELGEFWTVEDTTRELFSRLAAIEAITNIDKQDIERRPLYSETTMIIFRFVSSGGACAFWFNGSWVDMVVSGLLAVMVGWIGASPLLSQQQRIIFEAVASFMVGFIAAFISLYYPDVACFSAMALSGVLDILQGFRVVYAIIEIMSKHTVTGGADFLEGIFFTALIAYFLKFGQFAAEHIHGVPPNDDFLICNHGISVRWYLVLVPAAAFAWSGLFHPNYFDLPIMAAHGIVGYLVSWQFYKLEPTGNINNFLAALVVTFSSGIVSRFTGRQALGSTVAGLYVLLPGAYLVTEVYSDNIAAFLTSIILRAVIIGLGAWTGTILCSPTLLGTNLGLMLRRTNGNDNESTGGMDSSHGSMGSLSMATSSWRTRDKQVRKNGTGALLFF